MQVPCLNQPILPITITSPAFVPVSDSIPEPRQVTSRTLPSRRPPQDALVRFAVLHTLRSASMLLRVVLLTGGLVSATSAAPVTFGFSGYLTQAVDSSNYIAGLTVGTPFTGTVTYDPALTKTPSPVPSPNTEYYNFTNSAGLSVVLQVGPYTFAGATQTAGQTGIIIYDNYDDMDFMSIWLNPSQLTRNGHAFPAGYNNGGFTLRLTDYSQTVFTSDALPTARPEISQFNSRAIEISAMKSGAPNAFTIIGLITTFTADFQPQLTLRTLPDQNVQLAWPLAATGFTVESRPQLTSGVWQPVSQQINVNAAEHTVTLTPTNSAQFFRLNKITP